ncbi:MAG: hypothetical protein JXR91_11795 [Deltaproteobacteria bacterium]|nr:hypothetical protein [Deltaproteobacteria bacterium]
MLKQNRKSIEKGPMIIGSLLLTAGFLFYVSFRKGTWINFITGDALFINFYNKIPGADWVPSLLFVISFSLISTSLFSKSPRVHIWPLFFAVLSTSFELLQLLFGRTFGTADVNDVAASLAAGIIGFTVALSYKKKNSSSNCIKRGSFLKLALGGVALCSIMASVAPPYHDDIVDDENYSTTPAEPVYMSFEELREPVKTTAPEDILSMGKIYKYGNYVLINSVNEGIHIINNTDPKHPRNMAFINIPGNLDMAVKDNILYADSYVDLVVIDISNLNSIKEINRITDVFPYNEYQAVGDNVELNYVDQTKGVVIAYVIK